MVKTSREPARFVNPIISLYTTAYARLHLYDLIADNQAIYCDTDSLITDRKLETSSSFGGLKLESEISEMIIVKPKLYMTNFYHNRPQIKAKGLRLYQGLDENDADMRDNIAVERFFKLLSTRKSSFRKIMKFREAKRRRIKLLSWRTMEKNIDLHDDKRLWFGKFSLDSFEKSYPLSGSGKRP
jgi:hypothetical protein